MARTAQGEEAVGKQDKDALSRQWVSQAGCETETVAGLGQDTVGY